MNDENKRTVRLNVRLQPELKDKLDQVADSMGLPASTLGAVAIGEYVRTKMLQNQVFADSSNAIGQAISGAMEILGKSDDEQLDLLEASLGGAVKRLPKS